LSLDLHIVHPPAGFPLPDTSGAYFEFQVNRPARAIAMPTPVYPAALTSSQAAGRLIVKFIVGVDGRVEPASFMVIQSPAPELSESVRAALRDATFTPAEIRGRKVREVMMLPFVFGAR
jgi:protein TonB